MELKGKKAVFLGDSITEGVGVSSIEKGYVNLVKEKLELSEAYNRGISGTRFAIQYLTGEPCSFDQDFISRVDDLPEDVDLVVVFGGTNDSWIDAPIGALQYSDWTDADLKCVLPAFCYLIAKVKRLVADVWVILNADLKPEITNYENG